MTTATVRVMMIKTFYIMTATMKKVTMTTTMKKVIMTMKMKKVILTMKMIQTMFKRMKKYKTMMMTLLL